MSYLFCDYSEYISTQGRGAVTVIQLSLNCGVPVPDPFRNVVNLVKGRIVSMESYTSSYITHTLFMISFEYINWLAVHVGQGKKELHRSDRNTLSFKRPVSGVSAILNP